VVRSVTGEDVDMLRLGGPDTHGRRSGVVHLVADDEADAIAQGRALATLLADQGSTAEEIADVDLAALLPESPKRAYDVHPLIDGVLDPGSTVELHARWAPNMTTALGRLGGRTVGVLANNPLRLGGCLDTVSAEKAARFVRMCDTFGVPLVVIVDVPGYLPGVGQEWDGVVRRGAKLLHAFAEAVVPRVTLVTRKAYGGAYIAMNARSLGATRVLAWPGAEVAVMGPIAAVRILHRRKLAGVADDVRPQVEAELAAGHGARADRRRGGEGGGDRGRRRDRQSGEHPFHARRGDPRDRHRSSGEPHQHPALSIAKSDDLVQPPHRGTVAGVTERLEFGVPGLAEQFVHGGDQVAAAEGRQRHGVPDAVLGHHDVAVQPGHCVEDAEARSVGVARSLRRGGGLLGHLEPHPLPALQRAGQPRGRAGGTGPGVVSAIGRTLDGLVEPVQADGHAEDAAHCPLDVRTQCGRRGVDVENSTGLAHERSSIGVANRQV
jgi:Carboxyl transferase domain